MGAATFCGLWSLAATMASRVWFSCTGATCAETEIPASAHFLWAWEPALSSDAYWTGGSAVYGTAQTVTIPGWFCNCQALSTPASLLVSGANDLKTAPWNSPPYLVLSSCKPAMCCYLALIGCCQVVMKLGALWLFHTVRQEGIESAASLCWEQHFDCSHLLLPTVNINSIR